LDRAARSWAAEDEDVATIVASVDARRVAYIAKLLVAAGVESRRALPRAAFMYWAYLGRAFVMEPRHASIPASALDDITAASLKSTGRIALHRHMLHRSSSGQRT